MRSQQVDIEWELLIDVLLPGTHRDVLIEVRNL